MSIIQKAPLARIGVDGMAQIGPTKFDLRGIRLIEGEQGAGTNDAAAQAAAAAQASGDAAAGDSAAPWTKENFDPDRAFKLVENLRADLAESKTKTEAAIAAAAEKAQKDTLAQFAKLLAGEQEPETDPVKLAATIAEKDTALSAAQAAATDAQRTAQVAIHGSILGANVTALLADPAFKTTLASVDPTKEADIKSAITQALQANAALKQPPRSSGDVAPTGPTLQSLEAQLKAAVEKKDVGESIRLKRAIASARTA
jgi:hypothetical protein